MAKVVADAGKSFDPKVVAILNRRYIELEKLANQEPLQAPPKLSTDIKVERGLGAGSGICRVSSSDADALKPGVAMPISRIAAAREQCQEILRSLSRAHDRFVRLQTPKIFFLCSQFV